MENFGEGRGDVPSIFQSIWPSSSSFHEPTGLCTSSNEFTHCNNAEASSGETGSIVVVVVEPVMVTLGLVFAEFSNLVGVQKITRAVLAS